MSKFSRKKLLLAKIESSYGVDPTLAGANAMQVKNLNCTPLNGELVSRDIIRPYYGNSENLIAQKSVVVDFEVEMVGSGTMGVAPAFDALLRACALAKTTTQVSCSIVSATTILTITKSSHGLAIGDKILISGCTDTNKNVVVTVASVTNANVFVTSAVASATDESPAAGSPKLNTASVYAPISASFESVALDFNLDGIDHKVLGCRGTFEMSVVTKTIPTFKFTFTGLYSAPTDSAAATPDYSSFKTPLVSNTTNTPTFSLFSYSGNAESFQMQMANEINHKNLIGSETIEIVDRKPSATLVIELPALASKDFFALAVAQTTGAISLIQGIVNGYKTAFAAANALLGNPNYADNGGIAMISAPVTINPSTSGNDELSITFN